jgi:lipopolysaccharide/colanic/teichoic acid biosynthesis glycosyltransferase
MYLFIKRGVDIILSIVLLIMLSPILIPIIIAQKLSGEGEVFYKQERMGFKNSRFQIWKFATMLKNSPNMGNGDITLRNDSRVTPVGKYLRMTKINELPQIINLLEGNMTLVGPRPLMPAGFSRYEQRFQDQVYNMVPGITGIGSIVFRDEEKIMTDSEMTPHECYAKVILPYKGELELWYQKNASLYTDFMLVLLTACSILFPKADLASKLFPNLPKRNF